MMNMPHTNCPGCGAPPGQVHVGGCEVELCSECKEPYADGGCNCYHDPLKSCWTGEMPEGLSLEES